LLKVKKTAALLDNVTGQGGEVAIVTASGNVQTRLQFTSKWEPIQEAFEKLSASEGAAGRVLDGVDSAIDLLAQRPQGDRRLILVLSEARDRGSKAKAADVLTHAQQQNVTIYTATCSAYVTPFTTKGAEYQAGPLPDGNILALLMEIAQAAKENMAKTLADYTGGRRLSFATLHKLEEDLSEIGKEVHSQYQISFVPDFEKNGLYHKLVVKVKARPDAVVRSRPGYWR
jgi:VWFA-related protein